MPKTISIHTTTLEIGSSKTIYQKKIRNHHYFQAEDTGKYERALAQRKEAIDRFAKNLKSFSKKLHFPLDFF